MENNNNNAGLGIVLGFLAGAIVGGVIALLYAPKSGAELRDQIKTEADTNWKKASEELDTRIKSLQANIDKSSAQLKKYLEQLQSQVKDVEDNQEELIEQAGTIEGEETASEAA